MSIFKKSTTIFMHLKSIKLLGSSWRLQSNPTAQKLKPGRKSCRPINTRKSVKESMIFGKMPNYNGWLLETSNNRLFTTWYNLLKKLSALTNPARKCRCNVSNSRKTTRSPMWPTSNLKTSAPQQSSNTTKSGTSYLTQIIQRTEVLHSIPS